MSSADGAGRGVVSIGEVGSWSAVRSANWVRAGCGVAAVAYLGHIVACALTWPAPIGEPISEVVTFAACTIGFFQAKRRPALGTLLAVVSVAAQVYISVVAVPTEWVVSPPVLPVVVLAAGLYFGAQAALWAAGIGVVVYPLVLLLAGRIGPGVGLPPLELSRAVTIEFSVLASGILSWLALRTLARVHAEAEERRRLEDRLQNAQRLQVLGEMAGVAAHDFRNVLGVFQNAAALLAESSDPVARQLAGELLQSARSGRTITTQLLSLARKAEPRREVIDLAQAVEELRPLVARLVGPHCTLSMAAAGPASAVADPAEVEQVLLNLAANARDAMGEGGCVEVAVRGVEKPEADRLGSTLTASRQVVLEVADTGTGIAPEVRPQLFEPFVTTKARGQGTGLGLATVKSIATASGGSVTFESAVGVGTTFRLFLPEVRATDAASPA